MSARDMLRSFIPAPEDSVLHVAFMNALDAYHDEVLRIAAARQWAYWVEREMKEIREHGSLDHETEIGREAVQEVINVIDLDRGC